MNFWIRLRWFAGIGFLGTLFLAVWIQPDPPTKACKDPAAKVRCMPEIR